MNLNANEPISIGYVRDDGDLQILATLNNVDDVINERVYLAMAQSIVDTFKLDTNENVIALNRWDTPDYVDLEGQLL